MLESPNALARGNTASGASPSGTSNVRPALCPPSSTTRSAQAATSHVSSMARAVATRVGCSMSSLSDEHDDLMPTRQLVERKLPDRGQACRPSALGPTPPSSLGAHRGCRSRLGSGRRARSRAGSHGPSARARSVPVAKVPLDAGVDGRVHERAAASLVDCRAARARAARAPDPGRPSCRCRSRAARGSPSPFCRPCGTCLHDAVRRRGAHHTAPVGQYSLGGPGCAPSGPRGTAGRARGHRSRRIAHHGFCHPYLTTEI